MGPNNKVFDIWSGLAGRPAFRYAPAAIAPAPGRLLSDFLSAKTKPAAAAEPQLPPEELEKKRLEQWKTAVKAAKTGRGSAPSSGPPSGPFWKNWHLAAAAFLISVITALGLFLFVFKGSLAPVYLGSLKVDSNASTTALQKQITQASANYALSLENIDGKVTSYPLAKTGITIDAKVSATQSQDLLTQKWLQRLLWWRPIRLELSTKVDKDVFQNFLNQSVIKADQPYRNAGLAVDGNQVNITPEAAGKGQTIKYPAMTISQAIAELNHQPIQLKVLAIPAPIRSSDLTDEKSRLQTIINQKVTLRLDSAVVTATPADIAGWLDLNPVEHDRTVDISVNSGRVLAYLNKVAAPYIQPPRSRLLMTQSDGSQTVLDPGANGIDIVNKDKTATALAQQVLSAKGIDQKLDISYAAAGSVEVQPYDKWIVVDTTTKRMYAYEQSTLVRSFLVSAGAPRTPTVLGQYSIYAKYPIQDMRGSNADGSRYFQPDVQWVNYFYSDYAIHGNYWRPLSYFGNVNSSHGCVGVVNDDAKWIYDWALIGTPVIVHQ